MLVTHEFERVRMSCGSESTISYLHGQKKIRIARLTLVQTSVVASHILMSLAFPPANNRPLLCCQSITSPDSSCVLGTSWVKARHAVTSDGFGVS